MDLGQDIKRIKTLAEDLKGAEIFAPNPDVLEQLIELFQAIESLDEPTLVDSVDMIQFTQDGEEPKA
tara:strand:- start:2761 stop:2961 length:201 start_codon:yes stop_codon:yes gene_type:complete